MTSPDIDLERLVIFDLETTGLDADCKIVQIAAIRGERIYQSLVNPGIPIPPEVTEIHRIRDEDVADKPTFDQIVDDVLAFLDNAVLAGFNIRKFDVPVLRREVNAVGRKLPPMAILDFFELNQKMNPRSLAWFYQHYAGEEMDKQEAHDAVYDCICTRKAFLGMYNRHPDLPTELDALSMFAEPERVPVGGSDWLAWSPNQCEPAFTRGKYRGWALSEVARKEPSYLNWLRSIDADAATKNILNLFKSNRREYLAMLQEEHPLRWEPKYLAFRQAMDRGDGSALPDLVALAEQTKNPSLVFLAAAWMVQTKKDGAVEWGRRYLDMDDPYAHADRRVNFIRKNLAL